MTYNISIITYYHHAWDIWEKMADMDEAEQYSV